jgi:hypothetical protein
MRISLDRFGLMVDAYNVAPGGGWHRYKTLADTLVQNSNHSERPWSYGPHMPGACGRYLCSLHRGAGHGVPQLVAGHVGRVADQVLHLGWCCWRVQDRGHAGRREAQEHGLDEVRLRGRAELGAEDLDGAWG